MWWRELSGIFIPGWLSIHRDESFLRYYWATHCRLWKHFPRQWCVAFFPCKLWWTLMMEHCLKSFTWMHSGRCSRWMRNKGPGLFFIVFFRCWIKKILSFSSMTIPPNRKVLGLVKCCQSCLCNLYEETDVIQGFQSSFALLGLLLQNISFTLQASHPPRYVMMLQNWTFRTC